MTDRSALEKLDRDECLRLIAPGGVGRVAYAAPGGPMILPVNYVVQQDTVVFRTSFGGSLDDDLRTGMAGAEYTVAFEVDHIDEAAEEAWSVVVRGGAHHVGPGAEQAVAEASGVTPWAGGDRGLYIRIAPTEISGRRIRRA